MIETNAFDLPAWMSRVFPGLSLGGHLLQQWSVALRFEIGLERVYRAEEIFRAVSDASPHIVLVGDDGSWEADPSRWYTLFSLPHLLSAPSPRIGLLNYVLSGGDEEEDGRTLSWAVLRPNQIDTACLFQAVANQDRGESPSIRGEVYIIDPYTNVLFWMYDDRGMEVVASSQDSVRDIQSRFGQWILEARLETEPGTHAWKQSK